MNPEEILISERINEVTKMCDRENPIYEQISNFSIALYVFGYFRCADLLDADEVDYVEAGEILKENFIRIEKEEIPSEYSIFESNERYLMVIGDPLFPIHFAVIVDMKSQGVLFSKLPFFGSGFDTFKELLSEFEGQQEVGPDDISYYRMKRDDQEKRIAMEKIYTIRNDGDYSVLEYKSIFK